MRIHILSGVALLSAAVGAPAGAPALAFAGGGAEPYVVGRDPATFDRALECLTQAVYYEARSQSDDGQRAVAQVVLNRVRHPAFPASVCGVVYQGSHRTTGCQFTFTCDGSLAGGIEPYAWERARAIAAAALRGSVYRPVGLATNYHTTAIRPYWAPSLVPQITLGAHIFYSRPGEGTSDAFIQAPSGDESGAGSWTAEIAPRRERTVRVRYASSPQVEIPVMEIAVVERPVRFRTLGAQPAAASGGTRLRPRQAVTRSGPRVTYQGGVRITRGS